MHRLNPQNKQSQDNLEPEEKLEQSQESLESQEKSEQSQDSLEQSSPQSSPFLSYQELKENIKFYKEELLKKYGGDINKLPKKRSMDIGTLKTVLNVYRNNQDDPEGQRMITGACSSIGKDASAHIAYFVLNAEGGMFNQGSLTVTMMPAVFKISKLKEKVEAIRQEANTNNQKLSIKEVIHHIEIQNELKSSKIDEKVEREARAAFKQFKNNNKLNEVKKQLESLEETAAPPSPSMRSV